MSGFYRIGDPGQDTIAHITRAGAHPVKSAGCRGSRRITRNGGHFVAACRRCFVTRRGAISRRAIFTA